MTEFLTFLGFGPTSDWTVITSYVLTLLGLACMISASFIKGKNMKTILVLVFLGNALVAISYIFTKSWSGAVSCGLGAVQPIINFIFFESKSKEIPKWLIAVYGLSFVAANLAVYGGIHTVVAIVATLFFVFSIVQKNGAGFRICTLINILLWCTYDILTKSPAQLFMHAVQVVTNISGMLIHDRKRK